jgi:hypothetical protein
MRLSIDSELGSAPSLPERLLAFDQARREALQRLWFVGDVHGERKPLLRFLEQWQGPTPRWLVFVGDLDLHPEHGTFDQWLRPLYEAAPGARVAWIFGNHDSDDQSRWDRLQACGDAVPLHGRVVDLDGVRVAGFGGTFQGKVWYPPANPHLAERRDLVRHPLLPHERRHPPRPGLHSAIYHAEWEALGALQADILVTHEAPSPHPHGFEVIDDLARSLGALRTFHGHHHEDVSDAYRQHDERLGFQPYALAFSGVRNGLGELLFPGEVG